MISITRFFFVVLLSVLIGLLITPLRGVMLYDKTPGVNLCSLLGFTFYFLFTLFCLKKYQVCLSSTSIFIAVLLGASIFQLPLRIINFEGTLISLPDYILHLLGIVLGYFSYKQSLTIKCCVFSIGFGLCVFMYFKGYNMWLHKINFNTFTGIVEENSPEYNLTFQTNTGDTLSLSDFKGKYLLLDCWYTYCGVCYKEMPKMQQLYGNYKQNPEVAIYAMHCFMKETRRNDLPENYATGSKILEKKDFNYPCLSIDKDDPVLKKLGVYVYPTVLIFDKQNNLIFRGSIENAENLIKKLLKERGK